MNFRDKQRRLMRAVRFAITLGPNKTWKVEEKTKKAIQKKLIF